MKLIHISDLHLGKKVYEYSMIEEQRNALWQVVNAIDEYKPEAILIAGDIYDKPIPPVEAIDLFENFLLELSKRNVCVFIISGNHDSAERIAFGADIFAEGSIYISKPYTGKLQQIAINDEYGEVVIHLLPFIKPAHVRRYHDDVPVEDYNAAVNEVVKHMDIDEEKRNVVLVHQFITGAKRSDSEEMFLGGLDNVDYYIFDKFDYVALGHIHKPQAMGRKAVRYSGSPVKYAIDEIGQTKSMTLIELKDKGNISIETLPYRPVHEMREIKGTYMELTDRRNYSDTATDDYIHVVLTDEEDVPDALRRLRVIYPNILKLDYDNKRTKGSTSIVAMESVKRKSPDEYIQELYKIQNNDDISESQMKLVKEILEDLQ